MQYFSWSLQPILDALAVSSRCAQNKAAGFTKLQDFVSPIMLRLEQLKDFHSIDYFNITETIQKLSFTSSTLNAQFNTDCVFQTKVLPFIENIINNIQARFELHTLDLLTAL